MILHTLPRGWSWSILDEVALPNKNAIVDGPFGSNLKTSDYRPKGVPVLQGKNITNSRFEWKEIRYISEEKADELKRSQVRLGDLLMIKIGSIGYSAYLDELNGHDFAVIPANMAKISFDSKKVDKRYVWHWLNNPVSVRELIARSSKTAQPALSLTKIKTFPIPLPPLPEQVRIAAILDKAVSISYKCKQAINLANDLLSAAFLDMFGDPVSNLKGWERQPLKNILDRIDSGWSPKCYNRDPAEGEWGVLKLGAVTTCNFLERESKALPSDQVPRPQLEVKKGDLLFTRKNTYDLVAACALVHSTRSKLMLSDLIFRLRIKPKAKVVPAYLWALLTHSGKRKQIQGIAGGAAGSMPNISKGRLLEQLIEIPDFELQVDFSRLLTKVIDFQSKLSSGAEENELLYNSLIQRAFRGEL